MRRVKTGIRVRRWVRVRVRVRVGVGIELELELGIGSLDDVASTKTILAFSS